jgi:dCTP deaminase
MLVDWQIRKLCKSDNPMIEPFIDSQIGLLSKGPSSFGYDISIHNEYLLFDGDYSIVIDPKNFDQGVCRAVTADVFIMPPHSFALARSVEYFRIPENVLGICVGKSTYARCGLAMEVTPLEPSWEGHLTLELANLTGNPLKIYSNEGIAQIIFHDGELPELTYSQRKGKYQFQTGITTARVKK